MAQPMREMGRDACRRLFTAIGAADERTTVQQYSMTLVVRESTAAPRPASRPVAEPLDSIATCEAPIRSLHRSHTVTTGFVNVPMPLIEIAMLAPSLPA